MPSAAAAVPFRGRLITDVADLLAFSFGKPPGNVSQRLMMSSLQTRKKEEMKPEMQQALR
jgi:hypothetical protein